MTPLAFDEAGLRVAYAAHGSDLYRFALRSLGDVGQAQDVVQETFLRAWRAADRFDPEQASQRVWLFAIARNVVVDAARRRGRGGWPQVPGGESVVVDSLDAVADVTEAVLNVWLLEEALRGLSADHRQVIVETYLRGRSYEELSAQTGVQVGTLRSRCFYALKALRLALEEKGVAP